MVKQITLTRQFVICGVMAVMCFSFVSPTWALEVDQQTWFNSLTDSIATIGKDGQDKKDILRLRQDSRRQYRLQKSALQKRSQTRKRIKNQQDVIKRKYHTAGHTAIGL